MTDTGLFAEPERTPLPADDPWLVGHQPNYWRYMFLGEDSEWLMILGHVPDGELADAVSVPGVGVDTDGDWAVVTRWTYASMHDMCPQHLTWFEGCESCRILREDGGPLVLLTARADPDDAERGKPGWFPVTVVDLEA